MLIFAALFIVAAIFLSLVIDEIENNTRFLVWGWMMFVPALLWLVGVLLAVLSILVLSDNVFAALLRMLHFVHTHPVVVS